MMPKVCLWGQLQRELADLKRDEDMDSTLTPTHRPDTEPLGWRAQLS